jgi:hypothetical protein
MGRAAVEALMDGQRQEQMLRIPMPVSIRESVAAPHP